MDLLLQTSQGDYNSVPALKQLLIANRHTNATSRTNLIHVFGNNIMIDTSIFSLKRKVPSKTMFLVYIEVYLFL